jgi:hypothetical protein
VNSRLTRYRAEWKLMNGTERRTLVAGLMLTLLVLATGTLAVLERNWLASVLAAIVVMTEAGLLFNLRAAATYRDLYESQRDRPRAENWRQN